MVTAAQIAANRRNALKSTGPRTAAGKAASSRNALRHGLTARAVVVTGEDAQDFERLRAELWAGLAPRDAREEVLVETVVQATWRLRRAWRAEAKLFNRAGRLDPVFSQPRELTALLRYEATANRAFHRALALLERGRLAAVPRPSRTTNARRPREGQLEKIDSAKGTRSSDDTPAPDSLAPLASWRFDRSPWVAEIRQNPGKPAENIPDRPESRPIPRGPPHAGSALSGGGGDGNLQAGYP